MKIIQTKPVEQPDGAISNFAAGCKDSCFTAPRQGMAVAECPHYRVLFYPKEQKIEELCDK